MKIQLRIKKNSPRTYLEKITRDKYMIYLIKNIDKNQIDDTILKLVSKEFFVPPQKIKIESSTPQDLTIRILT